MRDLNKLGTIYILAKRVYLKLISSREAMESSSGDETDLSFKLDISGFIVGLGLSSSVFLIPVFLQELGASYSDIGLIGGVRAAPYAIFPALAGYVAGSFDMRKLYLLSSVLAAVSSAILIATTNLIEAAVANFLLGFAMVFYWPIAEAIIAEIISEKSRWSAYAKFSTAWSTAYLVGPMFGGVVADTWGLRGLFALSASISAAAAPVIISLGKLRARREEKRGAEIGVNAVKSIWPLYGSVFTFTIGLAVTLVLLPSYLSKVGWSMTLIGTLFTVFGIARTISYFFMTRYGMRALTSLLISSLMQSSSLALIVSADPVLLFLALALSGSTNGIYFTASFDVISRMIPSGSKGLAIGIYETLLGIGFVFGPVAAGYFMDYAGVSSTFYSLTLIALLPLPLAWIITKKTG